MVRASAIFRSKDNKQGQDLDLTHLYACWIVQMRHHWHISKWNAKGSKCIPRAHPYVLRTFMPFPTGWGPPACTFLVYSFISRAFACCVHSVSPVCPVMQFQVRFLMHFFTFKQFHCKQLYVFVYGSRWVHFFVPRTFTAGFFFSRGFSYPLYPALSGWYLLYPSVRSPLIPRAFPSLCAPLFATPCIHPRVT